MKIAFFCDLDLPNYVQCPEHYKYLHGRHSATGYYFWILFNGGIDNISLVTDPLDLHKFDVVIFHYDNRNVIENLNCKKIQVVTDRPVVEGCDAYIVANQTFTKQILDSSVIMRYGIENTLNTWINTNKKYYFIHYPPTFGVKQCNAQWPPTKFKYVGREHTNITDIRTPHFIQECAKHKIDLIFDYANDANDGTEDVYFCVRGVRGRSKATGKDNNSGKYGHRTANRLYQAWYTRMPGIFNNSPEMAAIKSSNLDYLTANSAQEFLHNAIKLREDRDLYFAMIDNGIKKDIINPYANYSIVVNQWLELFTAMNCI